MTAPAARTGDHGQARWWALHRVAVIVLVLGLIVTVVLAFSSRTSYVHSERRLTNLQVQLTVSALGIAQVQIEQQLGRALDLAAEAPDPGATFDRLIAPFVGSKGGFTTAGLQRVQGGSVDIVAHVGAPSIDNLHGKAAARDFEQAVHSSSLVTVRVLGHGQQRLGYLLSVTTPAGIFVAGAAQALPASRRFTVPASSPDADLNVAIYFGRSTSTGALIETNAPHVPLTGTVSMGTVPFGSNFLTIVATPRGSIEGAWAQRLPLAIALAGALFTLVVAFMTEWLARRREAAEALAVENRQLFDEQRGMAETLQRSLLPEELPTFPTLELAVRYAPGVAGTEVGGDWYDVMAVDDRTVFFSVGDVSGRGLEAATLMATLRHTINAYAMEGAAPDVALTKTERFIDVERLGHFATVLCGTIDTVTGQAVLCNAGHPQPLLIAGGTSTYVDVTAEPPVGVHPARRTSVAVPLPEHSILLAFTDGLVERRGELLSTSLERLRQVARGDLAVDPLLDSIVAALVPDGASDDIAILAVQWHR